MPGSSLTTAGMRNSPLFVGSDVAFQWNSSRVLRPEPGFGGQLGKFHLMKHHKASGFGFQYKTENENKAKPTYYEGYAGCLGKGLAFRLR